MFRGEKIGMEQVVFEHEEGSRKPRDLVVYALSTCGFCRRGLDFLKKNNIDFQYVYVDTLEPSQKQDLKQQLTRKFKQQVLFPFVVLDDEEVMVGFKEQEWRKALSLGGGS